MKKFLSILTVCALFLSLVACSDSASSNKDEKNEEKKITLKYANWNLNSEDKINIDKLMIEEFEKKNKNIDIVIDESIDPNDWEGSLAAAASAGKLPDVFMISNIPVALKNDWLLDITELTEKDEEWNKIAPAVRETVVTNDKGYAVPFAQYMFGYIINKDLFNQENLDIPTYGWSVDQFFSSMKALSNPEKNMIGTGRVDPIVDWYPYAMSDDLGFSSFDGEKFNFNSKEFIEGVNLSFNAAKNDYAFDHLSDEKKAQFDGEAQLDVFKAGQIGMYYDLTWGLSRINDSVSFDWDFVGIPGGKNILANDYLGIAATTKEKEAAYEFAKWMSFSKEGFMKRMELAVENDAPLTSLPISTDQEVVDQYFEILDVPGLRAAYDNIEQSIVEPVKFVPGFDAAKEATTGVKVGDINNAKVREIITNAAYEGDIKIEDYANQINELSNKVFAEANQGL
ncbi:ABC transporter substrate-binding protein [Bacillus sp. JJ722]|uniref:ABC transporter substrate-binding protein n=1 Tax=Bacillus sp. JJ722 TaxID=3122973 RepID=UPI002FFE0456